MTNSVNLHLPFISVVMPAFNEELYISAALNSVLQMDYPRERYEIIVVDNGSKDKTVAIAEKLADAVYVLPDVRVGAVRNYGVSKAKGDFIAFLDSDCLPSKTWFKDALQYMKDNSCNVLGGAPLLRENPSWVESAWVINPGAHIKVDGALAGGSIILEKIVFKQVGGFNEKLTAGEDTMLGEELRRAGYIVHIAKCCAFVHLGYPNNIADFTKRQIWQASSYLKSRKRGSIDAIFVLSFCFLLNLLCLPIVLLVAADAIVFFLAGLLMLPLPLSFKRVYRSNLKTIRIDRYIKIYILDFFYLLGRSFGLLKSILVVLKVVDDKKSHY